MSFTNITISDDITICINDNVEPPPVDPDDPDVVGREFNTDSFYSVLWMLVIFLSLISLCTLYGLYRIGRIPPPEKRPTESQIQ